MGLLPNEKNSCRLINGGGEGALETGALFGKSGFRSGNDRFAFAGVYLFTLLLHVRPNELFPGLVGAFPIVKIVAIITTLIYIVSRLNEGRNLLSCPLELKMVALIAGLAILFLPLADSPQDSIDTLSDTFLKIVIIFALMVNVVSSRERLRSLLQLVVICESVFALDAIRSFHAGQVDRFGRINGAFVGGIFGNPNDLALSLDMLFPVAVGVALSSKGVVRLAYFASAVLMGMGVLITLSRGGFIALTIAGGILLWKLCRRSFVVSATAALLIGGVIILVAPSGYRDRLFTILQPETDNTGSAQQRQMVLQRGILVAARHSVIGVGMGNFHIYSFRELRAHNSFVEIAAELGLVGLIAYLTLIIAPLRSLWRIERQTTNATSAQAKESYYMNVALQATLAAYVVGSSFASTQYFWFLYYAVAYAVSLRQIHALEQIEPDGTNLRLGTMGTLWSPITEGLLWRSGWSSSRSQLRIAGRAPSPADSPAWQNRRSESGRVGVIRGNPGFLRRRFSA